MDESHKDKFGVVDDFLGHVSLGYDWVGPQPHHPDKEVGESRWLDKPRHEADSSLVGAPTTMQAVLGQEDFAERVFVLDALAANLIHLEV